MEIKSKFDALIKILDRIAITIILATIALSIVFVFGFAIYDHFKHKSDEITVKTSTLEKGGTLLKKEYPDIYPAILKERAGYSKPLGLNFILQANNFYYV